MEQFISWILENPNKENRYKILTWLKESEAEGLYWSKSNEKPPSHLKANLWAIYDPQKIARNFYWENDVFTFTSVGSAVSTLQVKQLKLYYLDNILHLYSASDTFYPYIFRRDI
ncbi:hypothetical protein [Floridanema aerugineum]|uniref:Uncharacterized protein n=1 Tax=Floridaenema aerugineum BLCC-F46 TaxID=3153654 RepID=A0ABV4XG02_9CYAN